MRLRSRRPHDGFSAEADDDQWYLFRVWACIFSCLHELCAKDNISWRHAIGHCSLSGADTNLSNTYIYISHHIYSKMVNAFIIILTFTFTKTIYLYFTYTSILRLVQYFHRACSAYLWRVERRKLNCRWKEGGMVGVGGPRVQSTCFRQPTLFISLICRALY